MVAIAVSFGKVRPGTAWHGMAGHGAVRPGVVGLGGLRQGKDFIKPGRLTGYASVFNCVGTGVNGIPTIIRPGAFRRALALGDDVQALVNHIPRWFLASIADGGLRLREDPRGLYCEIELASNPDSRLIAIAVAHRLIRGMSFAYLKAASHWEMDGDTRVLWDVGRLTNVGPCRPAAFRETSVIWQSSWGRGRWHQ